MFRVFVYGSLKRGFRHHAELRDGRPLGETSTIRGFRLVQFGDYPALARGGEGTVSGELYGVSGALLDRLDVFEEVPELYQRFEVELMCGTIAWTYGILPERADTLVEIVGGVWRELP